MSYMTTEATDYHLTPFDEARWEEVVALADAVIPYDLAGNRECILNRKRFAATGRERRHYGIVEDTTGRLAGYGTIEQDDGDRRSYRVFMVPAADELWESAGSLLYSRLNADAVALGADRLWLREYSQDAALIAF